MTMMHNFHLVGRPHVDHFNIRTCLAVVGMFGVITIISYFNELSKAGLLFKPVRLADDPAGVHARDVLQPGGSTNTAIHRSGQSTHFDLDLEEIRSIVRSNHSKTSKLSANKDIQISVHLDKNASYESPTNASFKLYSYKHALPNYYLFSKNTSRTPKHAQNSTELQTYRNSTIAFLYQHEPISYSVRDCLVASANEKQLVTNSLPINSKFRKDWDHLSRQQKDKYQVLYGSLSFGVCESLGHDCSYLAMLSHPIDRILTVYHFCRIDPSLAYCHFSKTNISSKSLRDFTRSHGNSLFQKLLYYSRHCKLIGRDEVCLEDGKVTFVLTPGEREVYLHYILDHLDQWFSIIGLADRLKESLQLFDAVHNLSLSSCNNFKPYHIRTIDKWPYAKLREKLLNDTKVQKWIGADLAIYAKFEEIFQKQLEARGLVREKHSHHHVTKPHRHIHRKRAKHWRNATTTPEDLHKEALKGIIKGAKLTGWKLKTVPHKGKKLKKKMSHHEINITITGT